MACDLQYSHSGGMIFIGGAKCMVTPIEWSMHYYGTPKMIVGLCGDADIMGQVWEFVCNPEFSKKTPKFKGVEAVSLQHDGSIWTSANLTTWLKIKQSMYAIGSGMQYAMAAMESGKTPLQAVKIAAKYDIYTGKGYKEFKL